MTAGRNDWLAEGRGRLAAERILDAAGELFCAQGPATVGMNDIARAAGCSRATLYRYFDSREALHTAYVHGQAHQLHRRLGEHLAGITDPHDRLTAGFMYTLEMVRGDPALRSWFGADAPPLGAEMAERSAVITSMVATFLASLTGAAKPEEIIERQARWLVRTLTSLLILPGRDADDERAMVQEFLAPVLLPATAQPGTEKAGKSVPG